ELLQVAVAACDHEPQGFVRGGGERVDRRAEALALEARADEEKDGIARPAAELGARRAAAPLPLPRMERLEVNAVVDDVELLRRDAKTAPDLVAPHPGVADHGAQPRVLEHRL